MVEKICAFGLCVDAFVLEVWFGGITALATVFAISIAWYELSSARQEAAVRATFNAIEYEASGEWINILKQVRDLRLKYRSLDKLSEHLLADRIVNGADHRVIHTLLGRREYIAILLRSGGGDLRTYSRWSGPNLLNEWRVYKKYILEVRKHSSEYLENFEWLVREFERRYVIEPTTTPESAHPPQSLLPIDHMSRIDNPARREQALHCVTQVGFPQSRALRF